MKSYSKHLILTSAFAALVLSATVSQAQLLLTGSTGGAFQADANPYTMITNAPDGSSASLRTGVPVWGSFKSGVEFTAQDFTNVSSGDTFALGSLNYWNGITQIGTSSATAKLDFYLNIDDPMVGQVFLTTITFGIDATVNTPPNLIPDVFTASFTQPSDVVINGTTVRFRINDLPASINVAEDTWINLANVTVSYLTPVPEPATYGMAGVLGLAGIAAFRRFRGSRQARPTTVA